MAKILIIDDSDELLEMLNAVLVMRGHEVLTCSDLIATVKNINKFSPDLILLDVILGFDDGKLMCKDIKKFYPYIPVILMSSNPETLLGFEECNANAKIEKPFDINVLDSAIKKLLVTNY